jgi:hypothetical protein
LDDAALFGANGEWGAVGAGGGGVGGGGGRGVGGAGGAGAASDWATLLARKSRRVSFFFFASFLGGWVVGGWAGAQEWTDESRQRCSYFQRNVALLRQRLLRSNQVEVEQSELDQRRTVDMERTNALARRLMSSSRTAAAPHQVAVLDNLGRKPTHIVFHPHAPLLLVRYSICSLY